MSRKTAVPLDKVVIRFAGDSGDGIQLAGARFTAETAGFGNDVATLPSFPAEIRAPMGSPAGVSSFQLQFADHDVSTAGDTPDALVAMNPAALRANVEQLARGGLIVADSDSFTARNLAKAGYQANPLEDGSLSRWRVHALPLTSLTIESLLEVPELTRRERERATNMFALGLLSWMYGRPTAATEVHLGRTFRHRPAVADANVRALRAGWNYGETTEDFTVSYSIAPAPMPPGTYRTVTGNTALSLGLTAAADRAGLPLLLGSYPITPASDILHTLASFKRFGVTTIQAEDEIAAAGIALGASFGGAVGVTTTSGPGLALKSEMIGLAVSLELPLVVVDVQRAGPSTGLPTKTEQADLLQAMYGRNGESPVAILAPQSPADCFDAAYEAVRLATTYRSPVILLSDGQLANGSEPWRVPKVENLPSILVRFAREPNGLDARGAPVFHPYQRDPDSLARAWAIPGTPKLQHRIGGLEGAAVTGEISYDPDNHELMTQLRAAKVAGMARSIPPLALDDPSGRADVLVLGWGSTYGPILQAVRTLRDSGTHVARAHLRHLNPMPRNTAAVLQRFRRVVVPEMNLGQLAALLRTQFDVEVVSHTAVRGVPVTTDELVEAISGALTGVANLRETG